MAFYYVCGKRLAGVGRPPSVVFSGRGRCKTFHCTVTGSGEVKEVYYVNFPVVDISLDQNLICKRIDFLRGYFFWFRRILWFYLVLDRGIRSQSSVSIWPHILKPFVMYLEVSRCRYLSYPLSADQWFSRFCSSRFDMNATFTRRSQLFVLYGSGRLLKPQFVEQGVQTELHSCGKVSCESWVVIADRKVIIAKDFIEKFEHFLILNPMAKCFYFDSAVFDEGGCCKDLFFRPSWSPELLLANNYLGDLMLVRGDVWNQLGDFSYSYKLKLELIRHCGWMCGPESGVVRIPLIMYVSEHCDEGGGIDGQYLLEDFMASHDNSFLSVENTDYGRIIHYSIPCDASVSIIIPTRDGYEYLSKCLSSLYDKTVGVKYEVILVDNQSHCQKTLRLISYYQDKFDLRVINYDNDFNYSAINNLAVAHARYEVICLLNNDIEIIDSSWLYRLLSRLYRPNVGVVGAKLLYENDYVQHAGVCIGPGGCADHFGKGHYKDDCGYMSRLSLDGEVSAVTAACMVIHRELWIEVGGLDEVRFPVAFNDVDLCLKIRATGKRVIYCPSAVLYHHESVSRGKDISEEQVKRAKFESKNFRSKWLATIRDDPFYNPNLNYRRPSMEYSSAPGFLLMSGE